MSAPSCRMQIMNGDTITALHRLNRRFGRERERLERMEAHSRADKSRLYSAHADRCRNEATQWSLAQGMVEELIRKERNKP
jgi:hypothetical protein